MNSTVYTHLPFTEIQQLLMFCCICLINLSLYHFTCLQSIHLVELYHVSQRTGTPYHNYTEKVISEYHLIPCPIFKFTPCPQDKIFIWFVQITMHRPSMAFGFISKVSLYPFPFILFEGTSQVLVFKKCGFYSFHFLKITS